MSLDRGLRERVERAIADGRKKLDRGARDVSRMATSSAEEVAKQLARARVAGEQAAARRGTSEDSTRGG